MCGRSDAAAAGLCGLGTQSPTPHLIAWLTPEPSGVFHISASFVHEAPPCVLPLDRWLRLFTICLCKSATARSLWKPELPFAPGRAGGSTKVVIVMTLCIDTVQLSSPCGLLM